MNPTAGLFVKITLENGTPMYLRPQDIKDVHKDPQSKITTVVTTYVQTPKGFMAYGIKESCEELVTQIHCVCGVTPEHRCPTVEIDLEQRPTLAKA